MVGNVWAVYLCAEVAGLTRSGRFILTAVLLRFVLPQHFQIDTNLCSCACVESTSAKICVTGGDLICGYLTWADGMSGMMTAQDWE